MFNYLYNLLYTILYFEKPVIDPEEEEEFEGYLLETNLKLSEIRRIKKYFLMKTNNNEYMTKTLFLSLDPIKNCPLADQICYLFGFIEDQNDKLGSSPSSLISPITSDVVIEEDMVKNFDDDIESNVKTNEKINEDNTKKDSLAKPNDNKKKFFNLNQFHYQLKNNSSKIDFHRFLLGYNLFNGNNSREVVLRLSFDIHDFDHDGLLNVQDLETYIKRVTFAAPLEDENLVEIISEMLRFSSAKDKKHLNFNDYIRLINTNYNEIQTKLFLPFL